MIGYSFAFTADFQKAITAASRMLAILVRRPKMEAGAEVGLQLPENVGNVRLQDAKFSYPNR